MKNAVSGIGLAPDAAMVTFPVNMFLPGSDINPVRERIREIYNGLTLWKSEFAQASGAAKMITVEAPTYEQALDKANNLYLTSLWGDGLPLRPATKERVDWVLQGSTLPRTHVLGKFPPRGGITTVETCAIALAMAGGRPEYLPVLLAAVEACLAAEGFDQLQATSGGPFPAVIVNGPIAKQIRLNSGFGLLGPDPQRPAGASIGRALRLIQQNVGGALPGVGTMAIFGAMRYTNAVFAEDEDNLPPGWQPHATQRHGYAPGTNSVSVVFASGVSNVRRRGAKKETPEEDALNGMWRMADFMRTPNLAVLHGWEKGTPGIMMIAPIVAKQMAKIGWTQQSIREFLWENSKIPMAQLRRAGAPAWFEIDTNPKVRESIALDPWPICMKPDNIVLVVAGGGHPTHSYWLQAHSSPTVPGRVIRVPETFERLLADADRDLGCGDDVCRI
ncbi:MAG TPA: hypothetical protein VKF40_01750 [Burkholderiales bacterium]|nr:hypothetical protein [Burkholderiales bacterium]